jgi:hypothetical protein
MQAFEHLNLLVHTFLGGDALSPQICGSYLVAKTRPDKVAVDIDDRDLDVIQLVIIECMIQSLSPHVCSLSHQTPVSCTNIPY